MSSSEANLPWHHVTVTTDLSASSEPALHAAAELARLSGARVTLLHVIGFSGLSEASVLRDSLVKLEREYRAGAQPRLEALCERIFQGVSVEIAVVEGMGGASSICTYAREHAVDLLVIATHGRTGAKRFVLGSVTERVVQHAPCDVFVVRSGIELKADGHLQFQKIFVPTDFSRSAEHALERAVHLAKLAQGEIHLLHAYTLPVTVGVSDVPLAFPQEFFDQVRDAAQAHLDRLVRTVTAQGVRVQPHLVCDTPARAILEAAESIVPDVIVMGTHGRTGMKHVLLGSVAERTVRLAHCPVMTIKSPQD